jgi:hypothetical protein
MIRYLLLISFFFLTERTRYAQPSRTQAQQLIMTREDALNAGMTKIKLPFQGTAVLLINGILTRTCHP